jgi:hypothetical protein
MLTGRVSAPVPHGARNPTLGRRVSPAGGDRPTSRIHRPESVDARVQAIHWPDSWRVPKNIRQVEIVVWQNVSFSQYGEPRFSLISAHVQAPRGLAAIGLNIG